MSNDGFPRDTPDTVATVPSGLTEALELLARPAEVLEGDETYILVIERAETLRNLHPNFALLETLHPFTVSVTAAGTDADFVSRYFAPSYGIPEDPVTGSVHCELAPYWAKRLGKTKLHAFQLSERGGELWCEVAGDRVLLKGRAVVTLEGSLSI